MAGPTITIDPGTILTWDEATRLWMFARQMGLISGADWTVPTTPDEYQKLLTYVNLALQNRYNGLLYYGDMPAVAENVKAAMAVVPTDPALVDTISAQPLDDIVTTGGSIGTVIATAPGGSYGFVKKGIALATAISLLGATLFAAQLSAEDKEDLEFSIEPFTDEDGNVLCYTDEEGTTYLPENFIEAVRQELIAKGVYDSEPEVPSSADIPPTFNLYNCSMPIKMVKGPATFHVYMDGGYRPLDPFRTISIDENCVIAFFLSRNETAGYGYKFTYIIASDDVNIGKYDAIAGGGDFPDPVSPELWNSLPASVTYDNKKAYFVGSNEQYLNINSSYNDQIRPIINYVDDITYTYGNFRQDFGWTLEYLSVSGTGVPGLEPDNSAVLPSDAGKLMSEYFDGWYDRKKTFKGVHTDENGDVDNIVDVNFLPATLHDVGGLNEDTTQNQTGAQEGTPPDDDSVTDVLIDALEEFYRRITNDPTPPPTIPIDDSGDTPPAEPPVLSGSANGLWAIYNPTLAQVQDFGSYLWSENILDQITRMFNSPIDAVIGFHMIYCTPIKGPTQNIKCGYLDTGVASITVANQYATIDCGTVSVPEFYNTALDYSYTKLAVYLPFIGIVPLSTAVCMGASLQIIYRIDVLTGTCLAQIKVIKTNSDAVMYAFEGNCAVQIPLTATTYTGTVTALINSVSAGLSAFMGDYISAGQDLSEAVSGAMSKTGVKQSGSLGANAGVLGIRKPYLIITHPIAYDAREYSTQYGYPINQTVTLGSLNGYTRVKDIHLSNIPCTDDELEQIERLLKDGVIIN